MTRLVRRLLVVFAVACIVLLAVRTLRLRAEATAPLPTDPWPTVPDEPDRNGGWVEPEGGACPASHPVKVKLASGLIHQPGMLAYQRTRADRCYATVEAAEADGFARAKM